MNVSGECQHEVTAALNWIQPLRTSWSSDSLSHVPIGSSPVCGNKSLHGCKCSSTLCCVTDVSPGNIHKIFSPACNISNLSCMIMRFTFNSITFSWLLPCFKWRHYTRNNISRLNCLFHQKVNELVINTFSASHFEKKTRMKQWWERLLWCRSCCWTSGCPTAAETSANERLNKERKTRSRWTEWKKHTRTALKIHLRVCRSVLQCVCVCVCVCLPPADPSERLIKQPSVTQQSATSRRHSIFIHSIRTREEEQQPASHKQEFIFSSVFLWGTCRCLVRTVSLAGVSRWFYRSSEDNEWVCSFIQNVMETRTQREMVPGCISVKKVNMTFSAAYLLIKTTSMCYQETWHLPEFAQWWLDYRCFLVVSSSCFRQLQLDVLPPDPELWMTSRGRMKLFSQRFISTCEATAGAARTAGRRWRWWEVRRGWDAD